MNKLTAISILFLAAVLEAGGDALIRNGIRGSGPALRVLWCLAGGLVLFGYGMTVNAPPWDFGRLIGLYVVFFFAIAQGISWLVFNEPPSTHTLAGGALIVAGGVVIALGSA